MPAIGDVLALPLLVVRKKPTHVIRRRQPLHASFRSGKWPKGGGFKRSVAGLASNPNLEKNSKLVLTFSNLDNF